MLIEIGKEALKIIFYSIDIFLIVYSLYFVITGMFVFFGKKSVIRKYRAKHKFAIVVAARNEEQVIVNLLNSLRKQNYPKDLYDIFVVPNNCTDNTEGVCVINGAKIINCNVPVSAKGDALKFAFNTLMEQYGEYEAYCVFDADNIVHPEFIRRMNDALCAGYRVAQGYRDSKNPNDTWISSCYSLYYWVQNYFFNKARMNMGWSASINGTGFMIAKSVIEENGFNTVTMTEDIEFAAQCALNNERIAFVKDAITYDEQPLTFKQSWKQRKRWSVGTMQCLKTYFHPLIKTGFKKKIPQCMDMALFFLAPIVQVLAFVVVALLITYNLLGIQITDVVNFMYDNKIMSICFSYFLTLIVSMFVLVMEKKSVRRSVKGILTLSVFMLTWIPINIICMFKKKQVWEPIEHKRAVDIESIIDNEKVK